MATTPKSKFWNEAAYGCVMGLSMLVGLLPYVVLYFVVAPLLYLLIYRVGRYRLRVVRENLSASFPEKSRRELRRIERKFYLHLSHLMVDVIDMSSLTRWGLRRRMQIEGFEEFNQQTEGKSWIAALAHYGEWEYFAVYGTIFPQKHSLGVYHPLHSSIMERYYRRLRSRFGLEPVPMKQLARTVFDYRSRNEPVVIGLIADQKPFIWHTDGEWRTFLNQPTLFFSGMGHYAKRFGMPVYFLHIEERCPAHYRCSFEEIYDGKEDISESEITDRYAAALEKMIRQKPELWLWSHRRWKEKPEDFER